VSKVFTVGFDLEKSLFPVHGADGADAVIFRKRLRRSGALQFLAFQPVQSAMEARAGLYFWGREIAGLGHGVRLIPLLAQQSRRTALRPRQRCDKDWLLVPARQQRCRRPSVGQTIVPAWELQGNAVAL
jgi:hypothetical protein